VIAMSLVDLRPGSYLEHDDPQVLAFDFDLDDDVAVWVENGRIVAEQADGTPVEFLPCQLIPDQLTRNNGRPVSCWAPAAHP
jgi:hypothetical protein